MLNEDVRYDYKITRLWSHYLYQTNYTLGMFSPWCTSLHEPYNQTTIILSVSNNSMNPTTRQQSYSQYQTTPWTLQPDNNHTLITKQLHEPYKQTTIILSVPNNSMNPTTREQSYSLYRTNYILDMFSPSMYSPPWTLHCSIGIFHCWKQCCTSLYAGALSWWRIQAPFSIFLVIFSLVYKGSSESLHGRPDMLSDLQALIWCKLSLEYWEKQSWPWIYIF